MVATIRPKCDLGELGGLTVVVSCGVTDGSRAGKATEDVSECVAGNGESVSDFV